MATASSPVVVDDSSSCRTVVHFKEFVTVSHFHPSLIFVVKAAKPWSGVYYGAYEWSPLTGLHPKARLLAAPVNSELGWKLQTH